MQLIDSNVLNPVKHNTLVQMFDEVNFPEQKLKYLKAKGLMYPVMRGWYLVNPTLENYSKLYAANYFYGPSYISKLTALSYLGWIADRAYSYQSICLKRGKVINNAIGRFIYYKQESETFALGVTSMQITNLINVQIATPTKALYDYLINDSNINISGINNLYTFLEDDLRFDIDRLATLDVELLKELLQFNKKKRLVKLLIKLIENI